MGTSKITADGLADSLIAMVERSGDVAVARLCLGQYWTVVQTSSGAGLASTLRSERHIHGEQPVRDAGRLHLRAAAQLAGLLKSRSAPEASVGLATVNAVVNPEADGLVESRAVEVLRERAAGRSRPESERIRHGKTLS